MHDSRGPVLALDTASPVVSVALCRRGDTLAERAVAIRSSSARLVGMIDDVLHDAGIRLPELCGITALAGPGSFTGLRVGLATAYGFHQALGLPAVAIPTHEALAWRARELGVGDRVLAAVDALRDEWLVQPWALTDSVPRPLAPLQLLPTQDVAGEAGPLIGFGLEALASSAAATELLAPGPLARAAARAAEASARPWDPQTLLRPHYYRPPAITRPKRRGSAAG